MIQLYHNPRCSKSRCALQILEEKNIDFEVVKYLDESPTNDELKELLKKLDIKAENLVRKGEDIYKNNFKGKSLTEEDWIKAMVEYPRLIERPIFVNGNRAIIGRPPENVLKLL